MHDSDQRELSMELSHDDVQRLLKIIDEAEHLEAFDLVYGDFRLNIRRHGAADRPMQSSPAAALAAAALPAPSASSAGPTAPAPAAASLAKAKPVALAVPEGMVAIRAPMLGTFYRAPSPHEKPFVEVGQSVKADDTVGLIEVMKLFMSIKAGVDGKVVEIRAENAAMVEYDEVLVLIEPAKA